MNNKVIAKDTLFYFIGTLIVSIISFCITTLHSSMFSTEDYGLYSLVFSSYQLLNSIIVGWMSLSILRFTDEYKSNGKLDLLLSTVFKTFNLLSLLIAIIFSIIIFSINLSSQVRWLCGSFVAVFYFENQLLFINSFLRGQSKRGNYNINKITSALINCLLSLLLFYVFKIHNVIIISLSLLISEAIIFVFNFFMQSLGGIIIKNKMDLHLVFEIFKYGAPMAFASVFGWVMSTSDKFIIQLFYETTSEVGIYSYSYNLSNALINQMASFLMLGAFPAIINQWNRSSPEETSKLITKYISVYLLILIPSILGTICISRLFFKVFVSESYQEGYIIFAITVIGIFFECIANYYNKSYELTKNTKKLFLNYLIGALVNIILNFIFVPIFGYIAACFTTIVGYLSFLVIDMIGSRKYLKIKFPIADFIKYFFIGLIMSMIVIISQFLIGDSVVSLISSILIGIIIYFGLVILLINKNRKFVRNVFGKIFKKGSN